MAHFNIESGWQRGKGARRMPGRQGGLGKWHRRKLCKSSMHAQASVEAFREDWIELLFETPRGMALGTATYLLDQVAHRHAFTYAILGARG